jgi:5-methylcytosine-specific restriction endonuclease McrA
MVKIKKETPAPANNGFRLQLKPLATNKVKRFKDDIAKRGGNSDITESWLYDRMKRLLQTSGYIACETCGMPMTWDAITIDHKVPRSFNKIYKGNIHATDNLNIVCPACNSLKGQRTLQEFLEILHERQAEILALREQFKNNPQPPIIAPLYPDIGLGLKIFGSDKSIKKLKQPK